jgi:hypothetical protein
MIIEMHNHLRDLARYQATRVLVLADNGTPLAILWETDLPGRHSVQISHIGDADFEKVLKSSGIAQTVCLPLQTLIWQPPTSRK